MRKTKKYKELIKKLKSYWSEWEKARCRFRKQEHKIEKKMSKEMGIELEFFYGDMDEGCYGIGSSDWGKRKSFPLLHAHDFYE